MKKEDKIELSKEDKTKASEWLRKYMHENFDIEMGDLQSGLFVDYLSENVAKYYYNKGVTDGIAFLSEKVEDMYALMKEESGR